MANTTNHAEAARYRPREERRQQILDAAAQLATTQGLEATSIADVAEAAGLAKGSIYLHFESRHDLIAALQARVWAQMVEKPRVVATDEKLSWAERLDLVVEHWMRYEAEHGDLYHAVFHTVATDTDEPWHEARDLLRDIVTKGAAAGEFDLDDLNLDVVIDYLLFAYAGPCYHQTDIIGAISDVQHLFRRTLAAENT